MQIMDEAALSDALKSADSPFRVKGAGTRHLGRTWHGDELDVSQLSGVTLYEPGALTIVAKAGTPISEIEKTLDGEGQRLAFEPYRLNDGATTIGGVMATNASGSRRIQAGAARDFLLGVRFVDGTGRIVKNGGRVMKNVTGYDLVKLFAGSWGTLGVLTEVSLKVLPTPEATGNLVIHGLSAETAVQAMSAALGSPFEVSGAAHVPSLSQTWLRVEGFDVQVKHRLEQLSKLLSAYGECSTDIECDWALVRDAAALSGPGDLWRVSVRPSDGPSVINCLPNDATWLMDWGGGLIWIRAPKATDIRHRLSGVAGHATLLDADAETHDKLTTFHPEQPGVAALSAGLRSKFDPRGVLNPGLMA